MEELKCIECGGELETDDCIDFDVNDDNTVTCVFIGHCKECETSHEWVEEYQLTKIRNLKTV